MTPSEKLLKEYQSTPSDEHRESITNELLRRASDDEAAVGALLYILNDANSSSLRMKIVQFLKVTRPISAVHALTKEMFDPDPVIRAHAAIGIADYEDARVLAGSLAALFDALPDPATRTPAQRAILAITGRASGKITVSERERIRRGEHPQTIWPDHFASLPATAAKPDEPV
jgi:hypothetical protein